MVKGGDQQVLSVAYSYKAPIWCHYCQKNLLFLFFCLSLNKPPWKTKLTNTPPWWTLEKLGADCKSCGRWAFHRLSVRGNNAVLTTLQLWSVRGCFPSALSPRVHRKTNQSCSKRCLGRAYTKAQDMLQYWNPMCWGTLVWILLEAFFIGSCVYRPAPISALYSFSLGRRTMKAVPCCGHVWAPPPPFCGGELAL